jgi:hypothetical protein
MGLEAPRGDESDGPGLTRNDTPYGEAIELGSGGVVEAGVVEAGVVEAGVVEAGVGEAGVVEEAAGPQPAPSLSGEIAAVLDVATIASNRIRSLEIESTRVRQKNEESLAATKCAAEANVRLLIDDVEQHAAERRRFAAAEAERIADEVEQEIAERRAAVEGEAKRIFDDAEQEVAKRVAAVDEYAGRLVRARCELEEMEASARRLAESLQEAAALIPEHFD